MAQENKTGAGPAGNENAEENGLSVSSAVSRFLNFQELTPEERRSVLEDLFVFGKDNQFPFLVRMSVLLVLSTVIATAGLISDSAAVVIGAMLVAPMMNPVLSAAAAVVMGWSKRFYKSLWLVGLMGLGAILISSIITLISPELLIMPEQVLARTRPTYFDLIIALAAGSAGAYTITRKESGAIPGVAVAVALLPPLASAGILFISGEGELGLRAVVLFLTNLVAMVLAGAVTFLAVGVSPESARRHSSSFIKAKLFLFILLTLGICIPLYFYSEKVIFNAHYQALKSEVLQQWLQENDLELEDIEILREARRVELTLSGPQPPSTIGTLHERLVEFHELDDLESQFEIRWVWTQRSTGRWPLEAADIADVAEARRQEAQALVAKTWRWVRTELDGGTAITPKSGERVSIFFDPKGKFEILAHCGKLTGKFQIRGQALDLQENRNWLSGCRKDEALKQFMGDLLRSRDAYLDGDQLILNMSGSDGRIYFDRR